MSYRSRSVAIVVRNGKILMERLCYPDANNGKEFFSGKYYVFVDAARFRNYIQWLAEQRAYYQCERETGDA